MSPLYLAAKHEMENKTLIGNNDQLENVGEPFCFQAHTLKYVQTAPSAA